MEIDFEITLEDYLAFNRYCFKRSGTMQRTYRLSFIGSELLIIILILMINYLILLITENIGLVLFSIITSIILFTLIWIFIYPRFFWYSLRKQIQKLISEGSVKGLICKHHLAIREDGLVETTSVNESFHKWDAIETIEQDSEYIFIFLGSIQAHIIPRNFFETQEQSAKFFETARQLWEQAKSSSEKSG